MSSLSFSEIGLFFPAFDSAFISTVITSGSVAEPYKKQSLVISASEICNVRCVITGRAFALVGMLLFLIHNNKPEIVKRGKNRASRANNNFRISPISTLIFIISFAE